MYSNDEVVKMKIDELILRPEIQVLMNMEYISHTDVFVHSVRVAHITEKLIERLPVNANSEDVLTGALLHDVGKLYIPFNLNISPKRFTSVDRTIMNSHTSAGLKIVDGVFPKVVSDIVYMHHEKEDGSGYPLKLKSENIPDYVKVVVVADIYEALTAKRAYKKPFSHETAIEKLYEDHVDIDYVHELEESGKNILNDLDVCCTFKRLDMAL